MPELRVPLSTLLGGDGEPAEVPGWGYVPAWLARHLVARMHSAQWRYALCDTDGRVIDGGLITTRPATAERARGRRDARGGIVEIALRPDDLTRLIGVPATAPTATIKTASTAPAVAVVQTWRPVLTELANKATAGSPPVQDDNDPARRSPGAALRRWIQQRDRRCVHPCCRVPATRADQDHRLGYAAGGPTTETNLAAKCRHDHRLKDHGHWRIYTPRLGLTIWTSPLGYRYESRPPPAILPPFQARTEQPDSAITSQTSRPDTCGCMITPCPHDQQTGEATDTKTEHRRAPNDTTPDTDILDDSKPPF